jgi:hypothetical protein
MKRKMIYLELQQIKVIRSLKSFAEDYKFISSVILNTFLFGFFFLFFTPGFESNDDVSMMSIASGFFYEGPSEYLIFINIIIGKVMKYLYTIMPIFNWYVILFYSFQFFAMVVVFYIILKHSGAAYNYLLYIAFFIIILMPFLALLQFTTTAFLAGSSGMLLLISSSEGNISKRSWVVISAGILLVVVSGLLRINVFYLIFILFAPLIIAMVIKTRSISNAVPFIIAVVLFLGSMFYNYLAYYNEDPGWYYYYQYNTLRAQLTDYPYYAWDENTSKIYEDVGWSENDVAIFRAWSFADQDIFSLEDLTYIVANISPFSRGADDAFQTFDRAISNIGRTRLLFVAACFIIAVSFARRNEKFVLIATAFMALSVAFYFSYLGRLPFRIILPLTYTIGLISLYYLTMRHNIILFKIKVVSSQKAFLFAFLVIYILAFIPFLAVNAKSSISKNKQQIEMNKVSDELASLDYLYARWAGVLNTQTIPTFYTKQSVHIKHFAVGGWIVPSPHHQKILAKYSIENVYDALLRDDVLLLANPGVIGLLERYMDENYGLKVLIEPAIDIKSTTAYKVTKAE